MPPRPISFAAACAQYVNRFTMEHVPHWATIPAPGGAYYAPQYRTDREWYDNTRFAGDVGHNGDTRYCWSVNQTWPLGRKLTKPFSKGGTD